MEENSQNICVILEKLDRLDKHRKMIIPYFVGSFLVFTGIVNVASYVYTAGKLSYFGYKNVPISWIDQSLIMYLINCFINFLAISIFLYIYRVFLLASVHIKSVTVRCFCCLLTFATTFILGNIFFVLYYINMYFYDTSLTILEAIKLVCTDGSFLIISILLFVMLTVLVFLNEIINKVLSKMDINRKSFLHKTKLLLVAIITLAFGSSILLYKFGVLTSKRQHDYGVVEFNNGKYVIVHESDNKLLLNKCTENKGNKLKIDKNTTVVLDKDSIVITKKLYRNVDV